MDLSDNVILSALQKGSLTIQGEFRWGSNYTFLSQVKQGELNLRAVYKPTRGERPLWDFPPATLARREVAAYIISEALGWRLVPPTVFRRQGPIGPGSLQLFIEHDPEYHYFTFGEQDRQRLRPVVAFDTIINNADRKGSHLLVDSDDHIWLIDHGICFHAEDKLRTVIWDFAGEQISTDLCKDLTLFRQKLTPGSPLLTDLRGYLSQEEIEAIILRTDHLIATSQFPNPNPNRRFQPWPPL